MSDYIVYGEDELTIDGHRCTKIDRGVYEPCGAYIVTRKIWEQDIRNMGLVLITIRENYIEDRVVYVVTKDSRCGIRELQDSIDGDSIYCRGMENVEYVVATPDMADAVYNVYHATIKAVYPKYYPEAVADFFCRHHSRKHVMDGIASGNMRALTNGNVIVGTGCYDGNHIIGVYVLPDYQRLGCGSRIMDCLEAEIARKHDAAILDASLPAVCMYERRGYKTVGHGMYELENDVKLVYEIMEKKLQ